MTSPLVILGVRRSGTTLLRVILDRSPGVAIPDESYFVPTLAHRHRGQVERERFLDDLRRLRTLVEWRLDLDDVRARLAPGARTGEAIAAVFEAYAEVRGKPRWGDKTPMYMQHLRLLESLFPDAVYVHLVRDGRDVALSFLSMPPGLVTLTWAHPRDARGFACQWRTEVTAARALGARVGSGRYLELRYEDLVEDPEREVRSVCEFARLPFDPEMLQYARDVDVSGKPHQQRLREPPTRGVRNWRIQMSRSDVIAFEAIAGSLLDELGYELAGGARARVRLGSRLALARYRARVEAWKASAYLVQRSPLWRRRHPPLLER